jgi:plasmid stability protein
MGDATMNNATSVRLPDSIKTKIAVRAKIEHRSVSNLIEKYIEYGLVAEDNPDLPLQFIKDILQAKAEKDMGLAKPFKL